MTGIQSLAQQLLQELQEQEAITSQLAFEVHRFEDDIKRRIQYPDKMNAADLFNRSQIILELMNRLDNNRQHIAAITSQISFITKDLNKLYQVLHDRLT